MVINIIYYNVDGQSTAKQRLRKQTSTIWKIVFCAIRTEPNHGNIGSLFPGKAAVNMHPQQWETMFSVESVQRSYLKKKRRYGSVLSSR
jgi:hypothetical protein